MKKKIGYSLLALLVLIFVGGYIGIQKFNGFITKETPNYLTYTYEPKPIHFDWANDSIGDYYEKQTAMIIPLKIKGLTHRFYMQFDTGSPFSFLYENDLISLRKIGLEIEEVVKDEIRYVKKLEFKLSDNLIVASMIQILPGYGNTFDKNDTIPRIKIGTIGSDFIDNRITSIDFKNQKIELYDKRPESMKELPPFKAFDFTPRRRIMLPVTLDNKQYEFLYDSGCSAFGLITIKSRFNKYTDKETAPLAYGANSWGSNIPIITKPSNKLFSIGTTNLKLKRVSYVDMYTITQPFITPFTRIGGWMGNQPFNESTLILDTKAHEFIVLTN